MQSWCCWVCSNVQLRASQQQHTRCATTQTRQRMLQEPTTRTCTLAHSAVEGGLTVQCAAVWVGLQGVTQPANTHTPSCANPVSWPVLAVPQQQTRHKCHTSQLQQHNQFSLVSSTVHKETHIWVRHQQQQKKCGTASCRHARGAPPALHHDTTPMTRVLQVQGPHCQSPIIPAWIPQAPAHCVFGWHLLLQLQWPSIKLTDYCLKLVTEVCGLSVSVWPSRNPVRRNTPDRNLMAALPLRHRLSATCNTTPDTHRQVGVQQ